jgi:D-serine deaminase-like pyridoxal phosphate-dependent protein
MDFDAIDTPALLVDLDTMERNQRRMVELFSGKLVRARPHFKNHRVLALADRQMASGAIGITCARLWQAERLIRHGIRDVLVANEIAGESMIRKFIELSRVAPVIVGVDNPSTVDEMARLAGAERGSLNLVVDFDLGLRRCGVVEPAAGLALARRIVESGMYFRGVMGYEGHLQPLTPGPEKERVVKEALAKLVSGKELIERDGIPVEIVSCGGTGDCIIVSNFLGVTEAQPGSYLLMDSWYEPFAPDFHPALTVLATVISRTGNGRLVLDAGVKAISGERGLPSIAGFDGLRLKALHAEHAPIEIVGETQAPKVGEKVQIRVQYHDGTVHLHRQMYGIRNCRVEQVFRIEHSA